MHKLGRGESDKVACGQYYNEFCTLHFSERGQRSGKCEIITIDEWFISSPTGDRRGGSADELIVELEIIRQNYKLSRKGKMICYVYDVQRLLTLIDWEPLDVFRRNSRKCLNALMPEYIEFRDLRSLFGDMKLQEITERFGNTEKTDIESVSLAIRRIIQEKSDMYGDIRKIPHTLTGEVKSMLDKHFREQYPESRARREYRSDIRYKSPRDPMLFEAVAATNHGGCCLSNPLHTGHLIEGAFRKDRESCYPALILNFEFPTTEWIRIDPTIENIDAAHRSGMGIICQCNFYGVKLKQNHIAHVGSTYGIFENPIFDMTRKLLRCSKMCAWFNTWQLRAFFDSYEIKEIGVCVAYTARLSMLPDWILEGVASLYEQKKILKQYAPESTDYFYIKKKINAIGGLMQEKPHGIDTEEYQDLNAAFKGKKYNLAWGSWITSIGQYQLIKVCEALGDDFIYCDTDSVVHFGEHSEIFDPFNKKWEYIGAFKDEEFAVKFKTLGPKRYAFENKGVEIKMHVSGVPIGTELSSVDDLSENSVFKGAIMIDEYKKGYIKRTRHDLALDRLSYSLFNLSMTDKEYQME